MKNIFLLLASLIVFYPTNSYAYLDPGTISIVMQFIVASFAFLFSYMVFARNKIKSFLKKVVFYFRQKILTKSKK